MFPLLQHNTAGRFYERGSEVFQQEHATLTLPLPQNDFVSEVFPAGILVARPTFCQKIDVAKYSTEKVLQSCKKVFLKKLQKTFLPSRLLFSSDTTPGKSSVTSFEIVSLCFQ